MIIPFIYFHIYMQTITGKHYHFKKLLDGGLFETFQEVHVEQVNRIKHAN